MRKTCLNTIYELAKKNKRVAFIGSDLGPGVLKEFKKNISYRFFMEGVSEQYIIGMSAGLAKEGFLPYVNTISTFITRRCFEQIVIDLCLHKLPVKLIGNGGGLVYAPLGPTHQAIEDISILRPLPNISIIAPCDAIEMQKLLKDTVNLKGPLYIRIAKGGDKIITQKKEKIKFGKARILIKPKDKLILTTGVMAQVAIDAANIINKKKKNSCGVLHFSTIKPLDIKTLIKFSKKVKKIVTVEENLLEGGFGSLILEVLNQHSPNDCKKVKRLGLKNKFIDKYGSQEELFKDNKLTEKEIVKLII